MIKRIKSLRTDTKITIVMIAYTAVLFGGIAARIIYLYNTGYYL